MDLGRLRSPMPSTRRVLYVLAWLTLGIVAVALVAVYLVRDADRADHAPRPRTANGVATVLLGGDHFRFWEQLGRKYLVIQASMMCTQVKTSAVSTVETAYVTAWRTNPGGPELVTRADELISTSVAGLCPMATASPTS